MTSGEYSPGSIEPESGPDAVQPQSSEEGLGPRVRGPSFSYGPPPGPTAGQGADVAIGAAGTNMSLSSPTVSAFAPRPSRRPAVISIAVIAIVGLVVALASWRAPSPQPPAAEAPVPSQVAPPVAGPGETIDFTSSEGTGRLTVLTHSWSDGGPVPPSFGSYLEIEVELQCTSGHVSYDPYFFQAFDGQGQVFDVTDSIVARPALGAGTLAPGEAVRGFITFDMPRGATTLVMGNENSESVTAVRIRD